MRRIRAAVTGAVTLSLALTATACGGGESGEATPKTLTYWASNQGSSLEVDKKVLQPELDRFEQETGIKVKLEA
ncbi:sugar ABC transporter substrate-binding protein, partial [Streptomyces sp. NPDC055721]